MNKKALRYLCALLLTLALALGMAAPAFAADEDDARVVRVSCGINNALYLDDAGKPAGYCSHYIRQIAWLNNWKLEYVNGSWNESVQNLYDGKIDLLFPTQMTEDRIGKMAFSDYIGGYQPIGLFARKDAEIYYNDYAAFNNRRIAVSAGSSNAEALARYARDNGFTYQAVDLDSVQDKLDALNSGAVDMVLFSTLNDVPDGKIVGVLDCLPFYYCTRADDTELMQQLNDGMRAVMVDNPNIASQVYDSVLKGNNATSFTRAENDVIQKTDKIRIGVYADSLPLAGTDENGDPIGIYVDLIQEIGAYAGIPAEVVLVPRQDFLYDWLDDGRVDFVISSMNLPYDAADTGEYIGSESMMDYVTTAVTEPGYQFDDDEAPVFALTHARKYWESKIYELYPHASILYFDSAKDCLAAVKASHADVTLLNTWEYNYECKNPRFSEMIEWESIRWTAPLIVGAWKAGDPDLISVMDKVVDEVAGTDNSAIITSGLNIPYCTYNVADRLYMARSAIKLTVVVLLVAAAVFGLYLVMRRRNYKALEESNRRLTQANQAKTDFLSRMSHELRTPLNAITGYTQVMEQNVAAGTETAETELASIGAVQRAARYLLAIISNLLDIQKIESGKIEIVKEDCDAEVFMREALEMIRPEADRKHIRFTYERLTHTNDGYRIDTVRLQQVLFNLLHNAIKFTPEGGEVRLTSEAVDSDETTTQLRFTVADTGIGMSREFMETKMFHLFAQEQAGLTAEYGGCGTGLALSKELITLMGGDITCESEPGRGTTFTVTLPAEHIRKSRPRRRQREPIPCDLGGICILLCEDNAMNQDMEKRLLERLGCTVEIAPDGRCGCELFRSSAEGHYDMILMDIRMPVMDGLEATRTIRGMDRSDAAAVPILTVSANAFEDDVQKSLAAGMNEHLAKPLDVRLIREKILLYCRRENKN